jgi:hypothetical protein
MKGTILAKAAITFNTGASILGHAIAGTAVTCASACQATAYIAPVFDLPTLVADNGVKVFSSYPLGKVVRYTNDNVRAILSLSGSCRVSNAPLSGFDLFFCTLPPHASTTNSLFLRLLPKSIYISFLYFLLFLLFGFEIMVSNPML